MKPLILECVVGIDPGLDGGIAFMSMANPVAPTVFPMPTVKAGRGREIDVAKVAYLVRRFAAGLAVVERVHAMPAQGVCSMFNFGLGYGLVRGVLGAVAVPTELPTPQAWKKVVLAGTDRTKGAAVAYCRRRWPGVSLLATPRCKVPHDGMADALCLAEFGRRLLLGKGDVA